MRITGIELTAVHVNHRGDWVFLHIDTDEGLRGIGEVRAGRQYEGRVRAVRQLGRHLIGRDPLGLQALLLELTPDPPEQDMLCALSAVDMVLWDLRGKALGAPVYQLLGGGSPGGVRLYANINRATTERTPAGFARNAAAAVAEGFGAIKLAPFDQMPGGMDSAAEAAAGIECMEAVRQSIGPDVDLLIDCHSHFTPQGALEVAEALRPLDLFWFEQPVPEIDLAVCAQVRRECGLTVAGGEGRMLRPAFREVLEHDAMDVIMPDVTVVGGIGELCKVASMAEAWDVPAQHRLALAEGLRGDVAPRDLVPLHRAAWHALREEGSEGDQAVRDLGWARLLLAAGQPDEALRLARARLARLGPGSLDDLLAPGDGDGGDLERAHGTRVQLIELSVQASGAPDPAALLELARLRPLEPERLGALTDLGPDLAARVATALDLLDSHPAATTWADARLRPLPVALRRERLRHPATREGEALGRVQAWIAREADGPDYGALREYAQHIDRRSAPEVVSAIQDASLVLGWDTLVEGYVRHGQQTTGLRACDGPPPFLVVGADHLDPRSELFLGPGELRFLIGSEVAHLALGHARLTSQGLWDRVFDEAPTFLALLADLAPFIPVRGATLARGLQLARLIPLQRMRTPRPGPARDLAVAWGDLLAACRLMQLSADRAGLLICGDLRAATRGLLLASPAGRDALGRAERHGLHAALHRPGEGDELVPTQLALRVAALFSFWLSEDYAVLRDAIRG